MFPSTPEPTMSLLAMALAISISSVGAGLLIRAKLAMTGDMFVGVLHVGLVSLCVLGALLALDVFIGHTTPHAFF